MNIQEISVSWQRGAGSHNPAHSADVRTRGEGLSPGPDRQKGEVSRVATAGEKVDLKAVKAGLDRLLNGDGKSGNIHDYVGRMKAQLGDIVKNYPPDPERAEMLKGLVALRKQIDKMTIPPEYEVMFQLPPFSAASTNGELRDALSSLESAESGGLQEQDALARSHEMRNTLSSQPTAISTLAGSQILQQLIY